MRVWFALLLLAAVGCGDEFKAKCDEWKPGYWICYGGAKPPGGSWNCHLATDDGYSMRYWKSGGPLCLTTDIGGAPPPITWPTENWADGRERDYFYGAAQTCVEYGGRFIKTKEGIWRCSIGTED